MSCNGCRVLRKGCSDTCVLRPCIQWIDGADAQAHATVFVAKFFGRSTLLSFLSSVPLPHRPAAFRSLLYDACGRTINPVNGATGLLWTGNWRLCQAAVEAVLAGGTLRPLSDLGSPAQMEQLYMYQRMDVSSQPRKRKRNWAEERSPPASDLGLGLTRSSPREDMWRGASPSATSESSTTTNVGGGGDRSSAEQPALLNLFV